MVNVWLWKTRGNSTFTAESCALTCESNHLRESHISGSQSFDSIEKLNTAADVSIELTQENGDSVAENNKKKDIFFVHQGPTTLDLDANFLTAIDCCDTAILALNEIYQESGELQSVLRKKGWAGLLGGIIVSQLWI